MPRRSAMRTLRSRGVRAEWSAAWVSACWVLSPSISNEHAESAERFTEAVAPRVGLAADGELSPAPAVTHIGEVGALVGDAAVSLVLECPVRGFDLGAAARAKADARKPAARPDVVAGHAPVAAPMADHPAVVAQPVLINVVLVPRVLPLADLERQRKPPLDLRQLDAGRERRIAEAQAVVGRRVFAGILEIDRHGDRGRHEEP